ncbi:molybdopterin adenylyltransferase [Sulfobacillus acidophilus TPY]|uniref:Molybdopterin adenylyltransferase n=1 Tax=Sulfobacillus acidophilus (strain ATCC 700253 / DSM 10332 / NAL) TaxID=679936 RepID=G8TXT9_SULAD|nr:molybdopterin adenylyltransferase [Sulfobacillus acidophilus TPY]AEW06145.1 molybdopterin adenylyltransferase [Sulfobacillus acidophilus DSM 10332]
MRTIAVLTSSDASYQAIRADTSGTLLQRLAGAIGTVVAYRVLPDEADQLISQMREWVDQGIHLILTTGGTGLGPRDVMPEATRAVIDREIPGIPEAMRQASLAHTPFGMISRAVAGLARTTLIINFPGSPKAIEQLWPVVLPILPHALDVSQGKTQHEK